MTSLDPDCLVHAAIQDAKAWLAGDPRQFHEIRRVTLEFDEDGTPKKKREEVVDGYTIKCHANGMIAWSKGKMRHDNPDGYWE